MIDHANCEKKAAGNALSLLFRYPEHSALATTLSPLAREELQHFEKVIRHIDRLGFRIKKLAAAPYASELNRQIRRQEPDYLLDSLLTSAIIEARSHERLGLLGMHCLDPELRTFYQWLTAAEERHLHLYLDLATQVFPTSDVQARLDQLLRAEAEILSTLHPQARIHS